MRVLNANVQSFTFLYIIMAEHNRRGSSCQQWPDRERERERDGTWSSVTFSQCSYKPAFKVIVFSV